MLKMDTLDNSLVWLNLVKKSKLTSHVIIFGDY